MLHCTFHTMSRHRTFRSSSANDSTDRCSVGRALDGSDPTVRLSRETWERLTLSQDGLPSLEVVKQEIRGQEGVLNVKSDRTYPRDGWLKR